MSTIIIGDIHGCNGALLDLIDRVGPGAEDTLVLLGDLFDRGPDSWGVFNTVKRLSEALGDRLVLLRGNHEDYLLQEKLPLGQRLVWERVGRGATVKSFKAHGARMEDSAPWLRERCRMYYRGEGLQCIHAGLMVDPIEVNDAQTMLHDHAVVLMNRYTGPLTVTGHIALREPSYFHGDGKRVDALPYDQWLPLPGRGVICIDTGCGKGGRLTAMIAQEGQYRLAGVPER